MFRSRFDMKMAMLAFPVLLLAPVPAFAQAQPEQSETEADETPLVVTVRPRPRTDQSGFYEGAALEMDNGLIVEFTGWFIPKEVVEGLSGDAPADFDVENFIRTLEAEGIEDVRAQDIWLVEVPDVGFIIGKDYKGLGLVEIASLMDVDLSKPRSTQSTLRGFYGRADLFAADSLAARVIGSVNFE